MTIFTQQNTQGLTKLSSKYQTKDSRIKGTIAKENGSHLLQVNLQDGLEDVLQNNSISRFYYYYVPCVEIELINFCAAQPKDLIRLCWVSKKGE